ncbi:MAG TPA: hypothetical protein VJ385_10535 [Fibrobacteria bacterium]|nr:hypothetical protein [Fibrobacteria bacterium]
MSFPNRFPLRFSRLSAFLLLTALFSPGPFAHASAGPGNGGGHRPAACLIADPGRLEFGPVAVGGESARTVTLTNRCNHAVTVNRMNARPASFHADAQTPLRIGAKASVGVRMVFAPRRPSRVRGWIILAAGAHGRESLRLAALGRGLEPVPPPSLHRSLDPGTTEKSVISVTNTGEERLEAILDARGLPLLKPSGGCRSP